MGKIIGTAETTNNEAFRSHFRSLKQPYFEHVKYPPMTIRRLLLALFFLFSVSPAFALPNAKPKGKLEYTVDLLNTQSHTVHVRLDVNGYKAKKASYQMPVWAPGAYSVSHYGRYVENFKAFNKNHNSLPVTQVNDDRWEMPKGDKVRSIEYDVLDSHKDSTSLYFAMANIDTSIFFANGTALFGYFDDDKRSDSRVVYQFPTEKWNLACPLDPVTGYKPDVFTAVQFHAKNYDELADAPILAAPIAAVPHTGHIVTATFKDGSADYDVAVVTDGLFQESKMDSLTTYLKKIVHAETDFFHDTPFKHYTFEIVAPTLSHMPSFAQGALEHANSSDYLLADFAWSMFKGNFLSIFSHEFFHLWNVKRIHSNLLGPFDYTSRVMTKSLWMAEGITEYYAHTLLSRYNIETPERFYGDIKQWRDEMAMAPVAAGLKSLEELSIDESDFHLDEATLFYTRGPLVALMLDIEIRERTNNKHSLDDVMLALNKDAQHGKTFAEKDLIKKVEEYAGCDLTDFYNTYIHGTENLPLDNYLAKMGLTQNAENQTERSGNQTSITPGYDSVWNVNLLDTSSSLAHAGIRQGDKIVTLNGEKPTQSNIFELFFIQDTVHLTILRDSVPMNIAVGPGQPHEHHSSTPSNGAMSVDPNTPPLSVAIRKGIVGS